MTATADLIASARRHLLGGERQAWNQLSFTIDGSAETFPLSHSMTGVQAGTVLCVDLEEMLAWSVDAAAGTVTVHRGYNGSAKTSHTSGVMVQVNPKFSDWQVFAALNDDLLDLSSPENGLYQIKTYDFVAGSGVYSYDFPATGFLDIADIRWQVPNVVTHEWRELDGYGVSENLPTTAFASGNALSFSPRELPLAQQPVRVRYKAKFGQLTTLTDDVTAVTGLPTEAMDIPPLGAALRLMDGRPIGRADYLSQGDTRRADEVHVGDILNSTQKLEMRRQRRVNAEFLRLSAIWEQKLRPRVRL